MYNVWSFDHIGAVVSSGLGGGSLIYANVMLRKDPAWFVHEDRAGGHESWPVTREDLDPHYDRAEQMLAPSRSRSTIRRTTRHRGRSPSTAPRASSAGSRSRRTSPSRSPTRASRPVPGRADREAHPNLHGRTRRRAGCAASATSAATSAPRTRSTTTICPGSRHGAEIRTLTEVRSFAPRDGRRLDGRLRSARPRARGRRVDTSVCRSSDHGRPARA